VQYRLHRLLPDESAKDLDRLTDQEKKAEGLRIFWEMVGKIEINGDETAILNISEATRIALRRLYEGSEQYAHDFSRFDGAVSRVAGNRIQEVRAVAKIN
jgi:hypothetical protein